MRKKGGGRKPVEQTNPDAERVLLELLEHETIGDPTGGRPVCRLGTGELTRQIAERTGQRISDQTVARLLKKTTSRSARISSDSPESTTPTATNSFTTSGKYGQNSQRPGTR